MATFSHNNRLPDHYRRSKWHQLLLNYLYEIISLLLMILVCYIHAVKFYNNQPITKTFHAFWLSLYAALAAVLWIISKDWYLLACLVLIRTAGYNQILNLIRRKKMFYVHSDPKTGAKTDIFLIKLGLGYPLLWIIMTGLLIYLNFKL